MEDIIFDTLPDLDYDYGEYEAAENKERTRHTNLPCAGSTSTGRSRGT